METMEKNGISANWAGRPIHRAVNAPLRTTDGLVLTVLPPVITKLLSIGAVLLTTSASQLSATELRATGSVTNLVLSWDQDSINDFYLQVSTNLTDSAGWRNQSRLLVHNNHVEHWLNDRKVVEYELNSPSFNALVASSAYFNPYTQFAKASAGYIAFQLLTPEVWFRNIKVRQLASE